MNCRGRYVCKNKRCKNLFDFGVNRVDFSHRQTNIVCSICDVEPTYIPCDARLILEKDISDKIVTCKHYGTHTCNMQIKGRPDKKSTKKNLTNNPKLTRESLIRQELQTCLEKGTYSDTVRKAKNYTDVTFIDNIKRKATSERRPQGHSFKAVETLHQNFSTEDRYLIFEFGDGGDGRPAYVVKSSKRKVEMLLNLDKDRGHRLSNEAVYLDVLHSR